MTLFYESENATKEQRGGKKHMHAKNKGVMVG